MATWKKLVVSGSDISQLNNDAGYLTSVVAQHAFTTASYNGTALLADSAQGTLNFASSSGQGLTITGNAGTDTLTFGLAAVPNASLANSAITIAGTSTSLGGSITAATILTSTGVVSGSAQVAELLPAGLVSGSSQITYSGISGIPSGIVSASVLSSPGQGQALLTINGVAGSTVDLGLETGDSPTFAGVTAGNITVGVSTDNTITTTTGDLTINSAGGTVTVPGNLTVSSNLTVIGTASFQNTTNLEVADRFVLLASGSNTTGDGGLVIQQGTQNVGELFGYDSGTSRWALTGSFTANQGAFTPDAFMAAVTTLSSANPNTSGPAARYSVVGNIYVSSGDESIWIYS
jgi:hypothetical protein